MEMQETYGQQNNNSNYQKMDDGDSTSWYLLSIISWIIFAISMWVSYNNGTYIWYPCQNLFNVLTVRYGYMPIEIKMTLPFIYTYFFLISVIGFAVYLIFTTCKKNKSLYEGMLGNISKFHFIPLLLIAALYIISTNASFIPDDGYDTDDNYLKSFRTLMIFDLIFTIIALICLIVVYITTQLDCEWYIVLAIKKGVYSSFIILLLYNFFHIIVYFRLLNYALDDDVEWDDVRKFLKGIGIAFSILFGILSIVFSFLFKDIMAAFTTFLLYMGMVLTFFNRNDSQKRRRKEEFNGYADGVIDIIFMILSLVCITILILMCRQRLF
jgi:hypothetical protein